MSGVNISPHYKQLMGLENNEALLGGVVAVYYAGTLIGALLGMYILFHKPIQHFLYPNDSLVVMHCRWLDW